MTYHLALKKNEIMTFARNKMELEIMIARKIRQTEKDRYDMCNVWENTKIK